MKKNFLLVSVLILCCGTISESWATCGITASAIGIDEDGNYCGICNNSGTCKWKIDSSSELNIYTNGATNVAIQNYGFSITDDYVTNAPWRGLGATSLVIGDGISSIGENAFLGERTITSIRGMKDVRNISHSALDRMYNVTGELILPEGAVIGDLAFQHMRNITSLTIPDSIKSIDSSAFQGVESIKYLFSNANNLNKYLQGGTLIDNAIIICSSGNCQSVLNNTIYASKTTILTPEEWKNISEFECNKVDSYYYDGKFCTKVGSNGERNCTNGYALSNNKCKNCSINGQVEYKGQCLDEYPFAKKRWTPAEAAEWLHDGNDNFVIITFKK